MTATRSILLFLLLLTPPGWTGAHDAETATADTYRLSVQDKLLFSIKEDPIPTPGAEELFVNALGEVHFPVARGFDQHITLQVRGKTLAQVRQELKTMLDTDFYQNATVELRLREQLQRPGRVLFFGAVRGNFLPLVPNEPKTIFEGVYQVGVTEFANLKKVKLHRLDPATGQSQAQTIDLEAIRKGDRNRDLLLQDGDRVEVPEKRIVF